MGKTTQKRRMGDTMNEKTKDEGNEYQNQKTSEDKMTDVDDVEFLYIDPDGKIVDTVDPVVSLTKESAMSGIVILRERCVNYNE